MAETRVTTRKLDVRARTYVREHLTDINPFCSALRRAVDGRPGEFFAVAPRGTLTSRLYDFSHGGLLPANLDFSRAIPLDDGHLMPVENLRASQIRLIRRQMLKAPGSVCLADDVNPTWEETVADGDVTAFGLDEATYHLLRLTDDAATFEHVLNCSDTIWHGVAAVCERGPQLDRNRLTTAIELADAASGVRLLSCTAYDGEGFVGWRRSS